MRTFLFFPQVQDNFDRIDFNRMCWTLCARKNLNRNHLLISDDDAFKIWCIFNFLAEDKYPLVMVSEEVRRITIFLLNSETKCYKKEPDSQVESFA